MQETWVQSLVGEHLCILWATKPVNHNYLACAPESGVTQLLSPGAATTKVRATLEPKGSNKRSRYNKKPCSLQLKKGPHSNEDPAYSQKLI